MPIIHAFVAKGDGTVLAEYSALKGNTSQVATECLQVCLSIVVAAEGLLRSAHALQPLLCVQQLVLRAALLLVRPASPHAHVTPRPCIQRNKQHVISSVDSKMTVTCDK